MGKWRRLKVTRSAPFSLADAAITASAKPLSKRLSRSYLMEGTPRSLQILLARMSLISV